MPYMKSFWKSLDGKMIIEKKYHAYRALPTEPAVREKRAGRVKQTSAEQEKINRRIAAENTRMIIADNFHAGDWYIGLSWRDQPDEERMEKDYRNFKSKLRRIYKKHGIELKYIGVFEGLKGEQKPHVHMLIPAIPDIDFKKIRKAWSAGILSKENYGRYDDGGSIDRKKLAAYFVKQPTKKPKKKAEETKEKIDSRSRLRTSTNLIRRPPKKTKITRAETYSLEVRPPKGYHIVQEFTYRGVTLDGYPVCKATFERDG